MRAAVATSAGGPDVLRVIERPIPDPGPGELLVRVRATSVNRVDLRQRSGAYKAVGSMSDVLGLDLAGEVHRLGAGVDGWEVGDPVCGIVTGGAYAEYAVISAREALPLPPGLNAIEAAAVPEVFATAWDNLIARGELRAGQVALVHGGASGVGTAAIQLARFVGAGAIVTVAGRSRGEACMKLGAAAAIDYTAEDFEERVAALTEGRGVQAVLDLVGQAYLERNVRCLDYDGRLVVIGSISGDVGPLDVRYLRRRRLAVTGSTLRDRPAHARERLMQELLIHVWPGFRDGRLRPVVDTTYRLDEIALAHAALEQGGHIGKIVITID